MLTVKIKIAVAVDEDGKWNASGWGDASGTAKGEAMDIALDGVSEGESRYWIEAEVELPVPQIVKGIISREKQN